ncbi:hypothetical protein ACX27_04315 [Nostoc piscinale CENA21]|uniref:Uncharacterized protein n=1 Tax=Nostoc piscinale CENA21 TaxID=224013 RepID=A0A0M3V4J4_9NOSO|nr:hypothetical protein [Nostoc piscinale]ALF52253.1 hypothetical protein ACX27_04315 [Nostoc piscinale CENA21]
MPEQYPAYVDTTNLSKFALRLKEVRKLGILDIYRRFYQYYRTKTRDRYIKASLETAYAPSSIGRRKRNGTIISEGSLFGIDTTAMFNDYTQNVKIDDSGLRVWSEQYYAGFVEVLFQEKGPFAPEGVLFVDDNDLIELELIIQEELIEAFDSILDAEY